MTQLVVPSAVETPFHFGEVVVSLILALAEFLEKAMEREGDVNTSLLSKKNCGSRPIPCRGREEKERNHRQLDASPPRGNQIGT